MSADGRSSYFGVDIRQTRLAGGGEEVFGGGLEAHAVVDVGLEIEYAGACENFCYC